MTEFISLDLDLVNSECDATKLRGEIGKPLKESIEDQEDYCKQLLKENLKVREAMSLQR